MKNISRAIALFMSMALTCGTFLPCTALAEEAMTTGNTWTVTFTKDKDMVETYNAEEYIDKITTMQPGDSALFTIYLKNEYPDSATWSMRNEVIKSMEEYSPHGAKLGAYDYRLTYTAPGANAETVIYDSTEVIKDKDGNTILAPVGGETGEGAAVDGGGVGLHAATDELQTKEYFVLGNIAQNQTGTINLLVSLDGETQGNGYQDTIADLKMQFGVELPSETRRVNRVNRTVNVGSTTTTRTSSTGAVSPAKTGDDSHLLAYSIAALVSGLILLVLGIILAKRRKDSKKGGEG